MALCRGNGSWGGAGGAGAPIERAEQGGSRTHLERFLGTGESTDSALAMRRSGGGRAGAALGRGTRSKAASPWVPSPTHPGGGRARDAQVDRRAAFKFGSGADFGRRSLGTGRSDCGTCSSSAAPSAFRLCLAPIASSAQVGSGASPARDDELRIDVV